MQINKNKLHNIAILKIDKKEKGRLPVRGINVFLPLGRNRNQSTARGVEEKKNEKHSLQNLNA